MRAWLAPPGRLWALVAAVLGAGALAGAALIAAGAPAAALDWRPSRAAAEPWRAWSAALVHGNARHLAANLAGCAVVGVYGWAARAQLAVALAWLAAWPLTQCALALQPRLSPYFGLSGALHAGAAAVTVQLLLRGDRVQRRIGAAVAAGMLAKLALERPWGALLHPPGVLGVAVAPLAHASGAAVGAVCAAVALALACARRPAGRDSA